MGEEGGAGRFQTFHLTFSALFRLARTPLCAWVLGNGTRTHTTHPQAHTKTHRHAGINFISGSLMSLGKGGIVFQYTSKVIGYVGALGAVYY